MRKLGIIAIGYNRPASLNRLLTLLSLADYRSDAVDIIISLDYSGVEEVERVADSFEWKYGNKIVEKQQERLGLRNHILKCGSYMDKYDIDAVAVFEDDVCPSPGFYNFMKQSVDYYFDDDSVAGISLYSNLWNSVVNLPFEPVKSSLDVFLMRTAQSWGQIWFRDKWNAFYAWYEQNKDREITERIPRYIRNWPESSWLKYHIAYCVENNRYFVFPYNSLTTCFADKGEHTVEHINTLQVPIEMGTDRQYRFAPSADIEIVYDTFYEPVGMGKYLGVKDEELCVDLYGKKEDAKRYRYILTKKNLPYKAIAGYDLELRPHEMNVIWNVKGSQIRLYDTAQSSAKEPDAQIVDNSYYFRYNRSGKEMVEYAVKQKIREIKVARNRKKTEKK